MTDVRTLTQRELNRALLARQLLLERAKTPIPKALDRIGGIQAQYAPSMYVGLWSRLERLRARALTRALERGSVVQGTLMRATIHLVSKADYWPFAAGIRKDQREWWLRVHGRGTDPRELIADARKVKRAMRGKSLRRAELEEVLGKRLGLSGLALDLVRVPPAGTWERRRADIYALAEDWVGPQSATASARCRAARPPLPPGIRPGVREGHRGLGGPQRRDDPAGTRQPVAAALPRRAGQGARRPPPRPAARSRDPRPGPLPPGLGRDAARPRAAHRNPSRAATGLASSTSRTPNP